MVLAAEDPTGRAPRAGQFYMLAATRAVGRGRRRAPVPAARVLRTARHATTAWSSCSRTSAPGPSGCASSRPATGWACSARSGSGFTPPPDGRRALLVGGGVGIAPLAILQDELLAAASPAALLGFRDADHAPGGHAAADARVATDDGSPATTASSPSCSPPSSSRAAGRRLRVRAAADARGGAGAVRRARRAVPARARGGHGLRLRRLLRLRRAPARRRLHARVRRRPGARRRPARGGAA